MKKFLLPLALSLFSFSAHAATYTMNTVAQMEEHHDAIVQALDAETYNMLLVEVGRGYEVSITIDDAVESMEDGRGGDDTGSRNCSVTVRENRGGSVGGSVAGGRAGSGNAEGHNDRTFEVKGPCKEVREIVKDILHGGERRTGTNGPGRN